MREDANETLHYPMGFKSPRGDWRPFGPVFDYMPYAHRTRLVRTMNETYFLVNQLVAAVQGTKASGVLSLPFMAHFILRPKPTRSLRMHSAPRATTSSTRRNESGMRDARQRSQRCA